MQARAQSHSDRIALVSLASIFLKLFSLLFYNQTKFDEFYQIALYNFISVKIHVNLHVLHVTIFDAIFYLKILKNSPVLSLHFPSTNDRYMHDRAIVRIGFRLTRRRCTESKNSTLLTEM